MDEALAFLLALTLLAAFVLALLLGVVAFLRTRRLRGLTQRIDELERRLARLGAPERAAGVTAADRPRPTEPGVAERAASSAPPAPAEAVRPASAALPARPARPPAPREAPEPVAAPPAPRRAVRIDWERWVGVRGAAVVGGLLLALAGLLLVQYSIQRGWITPALRVALAGGAGAVALVLSELLHRRGYRHVSNALAGAGAVMLYGALWAGRALYGLFGFGWAFPAMVAVTLASGWMALRRPSLVVAVFALVGGFATPLLVSLGAERPLGLFGYLLVFDLGLVVAARRPRWGPLGVLGSLGTLGVFGVFALRRLQPDDGPLAIAFLGLSAIVLAVPVLLAPAQATRSRPSLLGAALALLGTFPLAWYAAARSGLEQQLLPLALLGTTLQALAGAVAWRRGAPLLSAGASVGAVALTLAWVLSDPVEGARAWHLVLASALLVAVPHLLLERRKRAPQASSELAAPLTALGLAACVAIAALQRGAPGPAPVLAGAVVLTAALLRQAHLTGWSLLTRPCALVPGALWLAFQIGRVDAHAVGARPLEPTWLAAAVLVVAWIGVPALQLRNASTAAAAWRTLSWAAVVMLVALLPQRDDLLPSSAPEAGSGPLATLLAALGLVALGAGGAVAAGSATALTAAAVVGALVQTLATWPPVALRGEAPGGWIVALLATALLVALVPLLSRTTQERRGWIWGVAPLAPWLWLPALATMFADHAGAEWRAWPALTLAACAAATWAAAVRSAPLSAASAERTRRAAVSAAAVSTLALLSLALTLQLERGMGFVAPALAAAGAAWTWRRLSHPVLPWLVAALLAWSTLRLGAELLLLAGGRADWPRTGLPVLHWGTYGWALPAAAALASSAVLRRGVRTPGVSAAATLSAVCGLVLLFLWVNLEVQNLLQDGPRLELVLAREPVRDAATSIAWGLYALGLLVAALRTRGAGLRWASLAFFLAALVKVFLVDLSNLEGLYRVASLAALALALLAVSLLYQRFVFRREEGDGQGAAGA